MTKWEDKPWTPRRYLQCNQGGVAQKGTDGQHDGEIEKSGRGSGESRRVTNVTCAQAPLPGECNKAARCRLLVPVGGTVAPLTGTGRAAPEHRRQHSAMQKLCSPNSAIPWLVPNGGARCTRGHTRTHGCTRGHTLHTRTHADMWTHTDTQTHGHAHTHRHADTRGYMGTRRHM